MGVSDTIAAIITAPGRAAVGIIRLSGPEAVSYTHLTLPTTSRV